MTIFYRQKQQQQRSCVSIQASIGIAKLLMNTIVKTGQTPEDALKQIWLVDSKGLVVKVWLNYFLQNDYFFRGYLPFFLLYFSQPHL